MGVILEENSSSWNNFSSLKAVEMKVTLETVDPHSVGFALLYWSALQGPQVLTFLKPTGMLHFLSTVSKTEIMRLTGKYLQCQCRLFVTVWHFKIGFSLKISCFITPQFGVKNSQIRC